MTNLCGKMRGTSSCNYINASITINININITTNIVY